MAEQRTRVEFNAPESSIAQADAVADLPDISRTQLLIEALCEELDSRLSDEQFQQMLKQAYDTDQLDRKSTRLNSSH